MALPPPACYRPFLSGRYEAGMGLSPLGTDFGQNERDRMVFQRDREHDLYRQAKADAMAHGASTCFDQDDCPERLRKAVTEWAVQQMDHAAIPRASDNLQTMVAGLQEDMAIVRCNEDRDWVCWAHICLPSGWDPGKVIGQSFAHIHQVVPGMETLVKSGHKIARHMTLQGPWVRFVWGLQFDDRLDQHPDRRTNARFDPTQGNMWLRVERQLLVPFADHDAAVFVIRPYVYDLHRALADGSHREALIAALNSMSPASRRYKNVFDGFDQIISHIQSQTD